MKKCGNCWWYCHLDSKCYRDTVIGASPVGTCDDWQADGLSEEEREALVTMEEK